MFAGPGALGSRAGLATVKGVFSKFGMRFTAKVLPDTNKVFSNRVLQRMVDEPGPYHNFPESFDDEIFASGTKTVVPNYYNKPKSTLIDDSLQYRLRGHLNGRSGVYEIFTRPSVSGRTELIMHRFFRPDKR